MSQFPSHNKPWIFRTFSELSNDDIELRVCRRSGHIDGDRSNANVLLKFVELYVQ